MKKKINGQARLIYFGQRNTNVYLANVFRNLSEQEKAKHMLTKYFG